MLAFLICLLVIGVALGVISLVVHGLLWLLGIAVLLLLITAVLGIVRQNRSSSGL